MKLSAITELDSEALVDLDGDDDDSTALDIDALVDDEPIHVISTERTQELAADDILEVAEIAERLELEAEAPAEQPKAVTVAPVVMVAEPTQDFTQPLTASMLPPGVRFSPSLPSVIVAPTPPPPPVTQHPSSSAFRASAPYAGQVRPSSIAPVAVEIQPPPAVVTLQMRTLSARAVHVPTDRTPLYVLGAVAGLIALGFGGALAFRASSVASRADHGGKLVAPAAAPSGEARKDVPPPDGAINADKTVTPLSLPDAPPIHATAPATQAPAVPSHVAVNAAPTPTSAPAHNTTSRASSAPVAAASPAAPAPAPSPAPAPAPTHAAQTVTTGVIHVSPSLSVVIVDGAYRRPVNGTVVVSCGPHKVKAGMGSAETIDVPCGNAVSM